MKLEALFLFLLTFLTVEILVRRLFWHQIPTQIGPGLVYALVVLNIALISWRVRAAFFRKNQKN